MPDDNNLSAGERKRADFLKGMQIILNSGSTFHELQSLSDEDRKALNIEALELSEALSRLETATHVFPPDAKELLKKKIEEMLG